MILDKKYFIPIYIFFLLILYFFFIKLNLLQFPYKYVFTDLLINYQGGFSRRGLIGEIVIQISKYGIDYKKIIFYFQYIPYILYLLFIAYNTSTIKKNFFWYLVFFSPLLLFYPLAELESLGRKDIYLILLYIIFLNLNFEKNFLIKFFFIFLVSCLIHEISFFFIGYYLFSIFFLKRRSLSKIHISSIILFLMSLIFLITEYGSLADIYSMTLPYQHINIFPSSGAFSWLNKSLIEQINIVISRFGILNISIYTLYLGFILSPFILLFYKNKNSQTIKYSFLPFVSVIPVFIIALDWGRFLYLNYNFLIITYIFLSKDGYFNNYNFEIIKSKNIKILLFIIYCFFFSPKVTLNDNIGSFPQYRTVIKIIKYF